MCQKECSTRCPAMSIQTTRARLAFGLALLFLIVLLVFVTCPQAVPGELILIIARLLESVVSFYFSRKDA